MEAKLIVVGGDAKATEIKLNLPTIIGRGRGATLTLPHALVSRQHCEIYEAEGQLHVRDMGSLNGTFVGNEPISEAPLPPGELLTVGAVTFRAIYGKLLEEDERIRRENAKPGSGKLAGRPTATVSNTVTNHVEQTRQDPSRDRGPDARKPASAPRRQVVPVHPPLSKQERDKLATAATVPAPDKSQPTSRPACPPNAAPAAPLAAAPPAAKLAAPLADTTGANKAGSDDGFEVAEVADEDSQAGAAGDSVLDDSDVDPKAPTDFPAGLPPAADAKDDRKTGSADVSPDSSSDATSAEGDDELQAFLRSLK